MYTDLLHLFLNKINIKIAFAEQGKKLNTDLVFGHSGMFEIATNVQSIVPKGGEMGWGKAGN